jgi:hypothetical protein
MSTMTAFQDELARLRSRPAKATTRRPLLTVLAVAAARLVVAIGRARTAAMSIAGFGCLTAAAWITFGLGAGLAAVGASLLVLEYLADDGPRR